VGQVYQRQSVTKEWVGGYEAAAVNVDLILVCYRTATFANSQPFNATSDNQHEYSV